MWTEILTLKIIKQQSFLKEQQLEEYKKLETYLQQIEFNDVTNSEGHAAKVYFNAIFGKEFSRNKNNNINAALNYGYSLLLSAFNREQ